MERLKRLIEVLDMPSGSIMGLFTLVIITASAMLIALRLLKYTGPEVELPTSAVDIYKFVVLTFAGSKAIKTVWGKPIVEEKQQ